MFAATTKKTYMISDPGQTCDVLEDAINTAFEGRPGPVHIHIPIDLTTAEVPDVRKANIHTKTVLPDGSQIEAAAEAMADAINNKQQIIALIGYGAVRSRGEKEVLDLIETYQIPFATTMDGKGILPENHPLSLGVFGNSGDPGAKAYFDQAHILLAVGNSFAQNATYRYNEEFYRDKKIIHINIDKNEIGKVFKADYPILSDAKPAIKSLLAALSQKVKKSLPNKVIKKDKWHDRAIDYSGSKIHPGEMVKIMSDHLPPDSIVLGDAGSHMLWLNCYLNLTQNQRYQNPGNFGPMASHVNGAIGVKCANPEKTVISACGDGGYLMGGFELLTAVQYNVPVIWVIFNNGEFNIIKNFLLMIFGEAPMMTFQNPDYVLYAKACGARGFRVKKIKDFPGIFKKALGLNEPVLIDVFVEENVYAPFELKGI